MYSVNTGGEGILLVRYKIDSNANFNLCSWKNVLDNHAMGFDGYISTTFFSPAGEKDFHYAILCFEDKWSAELWLHSESRLHLMSDADASWMSERQEIIHDWDKFWLASFEKMKKWKQWVLTFFAVYPLTLFIPFLVHQISKFAPLYYFEGIISAIFISGIMTYYLLPFMIKRFRKWLHK